MLFVSDKTSCFVTDSMSKLIVCFMGNLNGIFPTRYYMGAKNIYK